MDWPAILCLSGLVVGVLMGAALVIRPRQSHLSIGLASSPEKSGGVGESRAFGGMFAGLHGGALALFLAALNGSAAGAASAAVVALLALGWAGAFLARLLSVIMDREGLALNARLLALDATMAALIVAPVLAPFV